MPIYGSQGVTVRVITRLSGRFGMNELLYNSGNVSIYHSPQDIADAWINDIASWWDNVLAASALLLRIDVATNSPEGIPPYPPVQVGIGAQGAVSGDAMTAFDAVSLVKIPDVANREPYDGQPPRNGYIRLMGIPESAQSGQIITDAGYMTALESLCGALSSFTVGSDTYSMHYRYKPARNSPLSGAVPVADIIPSNVITSQVTRKRIKF